MDVDEALLSQKYDLVKVHVTGSTQISKATVTIISKLGTPSAKDKQVIVMLTAKARSANKLISVVEIAKRELATSDTKYFQYNALGSELIETARKPKNSADGVEPPTKEGDDESDDAFEAMGTPNLTGPKKMAVPVMTTYLSTTSVRELKAVYGLGSSSIWQ